MPPPTAWSWPVAILWIQGGVFLLAGALGLVESSPIALPILGFGIALVVLSQVVHARRPSPTPVPTVTPPSAAPAAPAIPAAAPTVLLRRDPGDVWLLAGASLFSLSWLASYFAFYELATTGALFRNLMELQLVDEWVALGEGTGLLFLAIGWILHYRPRPSPGDLTVSPKRRAVARWLGGAGALATAAVVSIYALLALLQAGYVLGDFPRFLYNAVGALVIPVGFLTLAIAWFIARPRTAFAGSGPPPAFRPVTRSGPELPAASEPWSDGTSPP